MPISSTVPCARGHRFAGSSRMNPYALMAHGVRMLLPFSERIAVRMMFVAATSALTLLAFLISMAIGLLGDPPGTVAWSALVAVLTVFATSFTAFVVLFSGFAQSSAIAMKGIGAAQAPSPES